MLPLCPSSTALALLPPTPSSSAAASHAERESIDWALAVALHDEPAVTLRKERWAGMHFTSEGGM